MNQTRSLKDQLDSAKYALDKAVQTVTRLMLVPVSGAPSIKSFEGKPVAFRYTDDNAAGDALYYFHSAANNGAKFGRLVQGVRKSYKNLPYRFDESVVAAYAAYVHVEELKKLRDAEIDAKRAGVKAKASLRTELNLQEGIKLGAVDVGQFKVILAGLEPVRLHAFNAYRKDTLKNIARVIDELIAVKWSYEAWNPYPKDHGYDRAAHALHSSKAKFISSYFEHQHATKTVKPRVDQGHTVKERAEKYALGYIQGYALKLTEKVGEQIANTPELKDCRVLKAEVSSVTLWQDSLCVVSLSKPHGKESWLMELKFHTQMIWNRSCYGLQFNQWPTRLLD